jgi:integrase
MIYFQDVAPGHARPQETAQRAEALLGFFGDKTLSFINRANCKAYVAHRGSMAAARRELEDLRAAVNHHRREGLCSEIIEVVLPKRPRRREQWLTRSQAAGLLWAAWRARQMDANVQGEVTKRAVGKHIARFILVGLYTGTRAGAICGASLDRVSGRGFIDLERGVFYRRAEGARETKKRQPPVPLPPRLLAHLRRWGRLGICTSAVVEWGGKPVGRVNKGFAKAARAAGLDGVSPHTLRHTAATWLMQNGADLWEAAGFLGMTVEMLERNYGHHHPDHLKGAVAAIGRRGHSLGTD